MNIRNIAIIAHVDHGKTTLVDQLFRQSGTFRENEVVRDRAMDSDDQERERGITITAKCTSIAFRGTTINIIDTPGHADFGGEVERVLNMADGALLLVDAVEGTMPQTRFVLSKALQIGLKPIVVINKVDRESARPDEVINLTFDLFVSLGANDEQCDFKVLYCSALDGRASLEDTKGGKDLTPLFETIIRHVPAPPNDDTTPARFLVTSLGYDNFLGRLSIGRLRGSSLRVNQDVKLFAEHGTKGGGRITRIIKRVGMKHQDQEVLIGGDIAILAGIQDATVGDTIAAIECNEALPRLQVDPPTLSMTFLVNDSPLAGKEGKFVTTRHIKERLMREAQHNVSLKVEETDTPDRFKISGRGELHLSVLIEQMRREGYELQVSQPEVIFKTENGKRMEPMEQLFVDVPEEFSGKVIDSLNRRKGEMLEMETDSGRVKLTYRMPSRGLLGYRSNFMTETRGEGIMNSLFEGYGPDKGEIIRRNRGSIISGVEGHSVAFAIFNLQARGVFFIGVGVPCYKGMVVGEHSREGDLEVNVTREKKLTNMRASGSDEAIKLTPPRKMTIEYCLEFIGNDELLEVTPKSLRMRKRMLSEIERKRAAKGSS